MIGRTLAHYRILEKLGSGGMGEVYVAEDTKLARKVALKVLPEEMATGERLSRFEREAKAIAALNHPNIVTVFSVEEAEGVHFITMELVRGKTLSELLPKNGFPLSKFFDIAIPLLDAVAAAHQEGITHRDLKRELSDMVSGRRKTRLRIQPNGQSGYLGDAAGGGEPVNLTEEHAGDDRFPSWSPDGRQIAYLSEQNDSWALYTVSALGGAPRRLISLKSNPLGIPQWSSDGTEIATSDQDSEGNFAAIVTLQTRTTRRLELPYHDGNPCCDLSWSPDGSTFAYVDAIPNAEVTQLWLVSSFGGDPTPVTEGQTNEWSPTWSADGRKLYFASNRGGSMDLWQQLISEDGKPEVVPQAVTTGIEIRSAVFSPDGTKLAYSRGRWVVNLWRVPIVSDRVALWGDAEQITFDNAYLQFFDLSPDGDRLLVSSDWAGNQDLWTLPSEGGEMIQLTEDPTPDWNPRWSPDGAEIAFYAYRSGNRDVWVMPSSGGPARQLTSHPSADIYVRWSPDGRYIAFDSWRSGNRDVWIVEAEGGEPRQLTARRAADLMAAWTPDGQWLIIASESHYWRVSVSGGEPELITGGPGNDASWSPDGKVMYYNGAGERDNSLWALALDEGREYRVADLKGRRGSLSGAASATDGSYLYFGWRDDLGDIWVMDVVQSE